MNTSRLRELVDLLLSLEGELTTQSRLTDVHSALQNMVNQPQNPQFQNDFAAAKEALAIGAVQTRKLLQPAQIALIEEIGGKRFFVDDISAFIDDLVSKNAVTPAVIQQRVQEFLTERQAYVHLITQLRDSLEGLGIKAIALKPGEAEIGFILPRRLFNNEFDNLIDELKELDFILRAFSELAVGTAEIITVSQISTSDPLFSLGMNPKTIAAIAAAITWALNTWKQVEEIRVQTHKMLGAMSAL